MKSNQPPTLTNLFDPHTIAVIGASRDISSVGTSILQNILDSGFTGKVIPVNPHTEELLGLPVVHDISEVKDEVDIAIISVPAKLVPLVLAGGTGIVKHAIIITAGFGENGKEGKILEDETLAAAKKAGTRIIGPNTLGMILPSKHLNASFAKTMGVKGSIALITQSGALGSSFLDIAKSRNIGLSAFMSIGNMIDITETELLSYFVSDPETQTIALYMESLSDAPSFIAAVRAARSKGKRVIVLKAGKTTKGQKAASTHTGAFAADKQLYEGLFKQAGVIEAIDCEHFVNMLALAGTIKDSAPPLIILTNAGGPGILACDAAETFHLTLADTEEFPNPYDIRGDATAKAYEDALRKIESLYPGHPILVITTPQTVTDSENIAKVIIESQRRNICPIIVSFIGDISFTKAKTLIIDASIPSLSYPEDALAAAGSLIGLPHNTSQKKEEEKPETDVKTVKTKEALELLRVGGLPIARFGIAITPGDIQKIVSGIGTPTYALKIISPDISHKSEVGGVALDVITSEIPAAFQRMWATVSAKAPRARIEGICIMEMIHMNDSIELFFGMKKDKHLGNAFILGIGGIYTNIIADVQTRFMPYDEADILSMISSLKLYPVLTGARGKKPYAIKKIIDTALLFQTLIVGHPEILEFDINPILLTDQKAVIIDARMTTDGS